MFTSCQKIILLNLKMSNLEFKNVIYPSLTLNRNIGTCAKSSTKVLNQLTSAVGNLLGQHKCVRTCTCISYPGFSNYKFMVHTKFICQSKSFWQIFYNKSTHLYRYKTKKHPPTQKYMHTWSIKNVCLQTIRSAKQYSGFTFH